MSACFVAASAAQLMIKPNATRSQLTALGLAAAVLFVLGLALTVLRFNECRAFGFSVLYCIGR